MIWLDFNRSNVPGDTNVQWAYMSSKGEFKIVKTNCNEVVRVSF